MQRPSSQIGSPQTPCFVHVTGTRPGRTADFVDFEFIVGDTDLSIEMVMPRQAFDEFCRRYAAKPLPPERRRPLEVTGPARFLAYPPPPKKQPNRIQKI
jgi:phenol hydroxylase P0 protein